jgi:ABC-type cobalamin/Fe3+-siderophores transport system ATPase subunit
MDKWLKFSNVVYGYRADEPPVFTGLNISLPKGVTALVGPNGSGKTTFMLLAGGRVAPQEGSVQLFDRETSELTDENLRNRYASFVYQNMEFETEEPVGTLLEEVYEMGFFEHKDPQLISELKEVLELEGLLARKTQELSKGELQRVIIAFAVLYGSKSLMMDEPIFALEQYQKERVMEYLTSFAADQDISVLYSLHELDLTKRYTDRILLFYQQGNLELGSVEETTSREKLETAYEVPYDYLRRRQHFYREGLMKIAENMTKDEDSGGPTEGGGE